MLCCRGFELFSRWVPLKNTVFHCQICKFVGVLLPSSSWLLKLPNNYSARLNQDGNYTEFEDTLV